MAAFLYEYSQEFPSAKLNKEWSSYRIKIGGVDEEVKPMDLLTRKDGPKLKLTATTTAIKWEEVFFKVIMNNRMMKVRTSPDAQYISNMNTKLMALGRSCSWKINLSGKIDTVRLDSALEDPNVRKIISAIDMFLFRFNEHGLGFLRAGTLTSRHKQSMILLDIYFADMAFYIPPWSNPRVDLDRPGCGRN
jgi:Rhabdovirus nucleocapsid protein